MELAGLSTPESQWLAARVPHAPAMVCTSYQVQPAAIRAGLGVGVGPRMYADLDPDFPALAHPPTGVTGLARYAATPTCPPTAPPGIQCYVWNTNGAARLGAAPTPTSVACRSTTRTW